MSHYLLTGLLAITLFTACQQTAKKHMHKANPLDELLAGNQRYKEGHPVHPDETLDRLRELKKGQHPFAVIVSCSDSRVPPELIFDQGLGDLFVVRNAGNIIGDYELGSIEYAVEHLQTKLIVVLGHEECGAIKAYLEHKGDTLHNHIQSIVTFIAQEEEEQALADSLKNNIDAAVHANVLHGIHQLKSSEPVLAPLIRDKKVQVIGAIYSLENGEVRLLQE
jgi:carbonic anhydrase